MTPETVSATTDGQTATLAKRADFGVDLCREGNWQEGVKVLGRVAENLSDGVELPADFYSYLGYGIAREENRIKEGVALCQHAIKKEFYQPDHYANLARTYLISGRRLGAFKALRRGLSMAPRHSSLRLIQRDMGIRRQLSVPFLYRSHSINRFIGRLRHELFKPRRW